MILVTVLRIALIATLGLKSSHAFERDKFFQCAHNKVEYLVGGAVENKMKKWCLKTSNKDSPSALNKKNIKNESVKHPQNLLFTYKFDDVARKEILFQELTKEQSEIAKKSSLPTSQENSETINRHKRNIESISAEIKRM